MIWLAAALLTVLAIVAVSRPLSRERSGKTDNAEADAYRLRLEDLDRDIERGVMTADEGRLTRIEVSRRLLRAGRKNAASPGEKRARGAAPNVAFFLMAGMLGAGSLLLYARFGKPGLPDQPLEARLALPPDRQPIEIQIANIERRLAANPRDAAGWNVIAPVYFRLQQFEKAASAYERLIQIEGPNESNLLGYGEAQTFGNEGTITDAARQAFQLAVDRDPKSLRGRFWVAMTAEQDGRIADAEGLYRVLLAEGVSDNGKKVIEQRLAILAGANTQSAGQENANAALGPQGPMIRQMVDGLAARLKDNPGDLDGWLKLIRSYGVLGERDNKAAAIDTARARFKSDAAAMAAIDGLVASLNERAPAPASPPASEQGSGQAAMISGMVQRLAGRLKDNPNDLEGWLRLIRSYSVLGDGAREREAIATARTAFADDSVARAKIDALTSELSASVTAQTESKATP